MKTREDVETLKTKWALDPCWDIEDTEGFGEYVDELAAFRAEFERLEQEKLDKRESRDAGLVYIPQHRSLIDARHIHAVILETRGVSFRVRDEAWYIACDSREHAMATFNDLRRAMITARKGNTEDLVGEIDALYGVIDKRLGQIDSSLSSINAEIFTIRRSL